MVSQVTNTCNLPARQDALRYFGCCPTAHTILRACLQGTDVRPYLLVPLSLVNYVERKRGALGTRLRGKFDTNAFMVRSRGLEFGQSAFIG